MEIRPAQAADYPAIAAIMTGTSPDQPASAGSLARQDSTRRDDLLHVLLVAEDGGRVVGYAQYTQYADSLEPHTVRVSIGVHSRTQRQGVGAALYDALLERARRQPIEWFKMRIRADQFAGLHFAARRGFVEYGRRIEARLALADFDPAAYPDPDALMAEQGLALESIAQYATTPDREHALHALKWEIEQDIPIPEPVTNITFDDFRAQVLAAEDFLRDGSFAAVDGVRPVGLLLTFAAGIHAVDVDLTGTARDYRRRGIAFALKLKGTVWAKAAGCRTMSVTNDLTNIGMLALNERLGYKRLPSIVLLKRRI